MSKAQRKQTQSARARIAEQQRLARERERRRRMLAIGGTAVAVLAVVGIVIGALVSSSGPGSSAGTTPGGHALPASVQRDVSTVPASALTAVGSGSAAASGIRSVTTTPLTSAGKPEMLYIGAEWCPYCAAERWAMAVALSRFGTFSPLHGIHSSSSDVYPNTATLTFYRSTYTSNYLVFTPVENQDLNHNTLQQPTAAQQALWTRYGSDSFPFIDIGNRFVAASTYNPQVLAGMNWSQIAAALHNPSSPVAQGAVGSANLFTAAICKVTGNRPANVCTAPPVSTLAGQI